MKRVLITGAGSYIGMSFENWIKEHSDSIVTETQDMKDPAWRNRDFHGYDSVFHVAGIAHADVGRVTEEQKALYYKVNADLTVECARKAKAEGVKQFIFMSSIIVYGDSARIGRKYVITRETPLAPANFYGDSKVKAEQGLQGLADENFKVVILRPPMIYGKGSKGNYPLLAKLAGKLPVFPDVKNQRSMLYVGNLCKFVSLMIENEESGVFFPQNSRYVRTGEMVKLIGEARGKKVRMVKVFNPFLRLMGRLGGKPGGMVNKAFGNMVYDKEMSEYRDAYQIYGLEESIRLTEEKQRNRRRKPETQRADMSNSPLVTITTVTYNSAKTLAQTIESVLGQTYRPIEYIIVDGLSKDDTVAIAKSYEEAFRRKGIAYRIISEEDNGMYDAINKGIDLAKGEIIGNINSDDWYEPKAVEKVVRFFQDTGCDLMYADLRMIRKDGTSFIKRSKKTRIATSRGWNHPTQFARKSLYDQEKYKCESLHDDFDLLLRVKRKGYQIEILHEVIANFRMDGMSHDRNIRRAIERGRARYRIYRNNGYSRLYLLECVFIEAAKFVIG